MDSHEGKYQKVMLIGGSGPCDGPSEGRFPSHCHHRLHGGGQMQVVRSSFHRTEPMLPVRTISPVQYRTRWLNKVHLVTCFNLAFVILLAVLTSGVEAQIASQPVSFPPTVFVQQPQAGSPEITGNTKVLLCQATGMPTPVYLWKKDGEYITEENITETSLKIHNIERSDDGEYQCIASNDVGAIMSRKVHVRVAYIVPFASSGSSDLHVDQGQAYVIDAPSIQSFPQPLIKWFEIGNSMYAIPGETTKYHVTLASQLVILETRMTDSGKVYKARATNSYTGQQSDSQMFVLNVQNVGSLTADIPPEIVIPPSHTSAVQGDDDAVIFECVANARPINYLHISWYRVTESGRTLLEQDGLKYLISLMRRQLTIKTPVTTDTGVYECEATLERPGNQDIPKASASANLTVLVRPGIATPPPSDISADYGSDVEITCQGVGTPIPTSTWYRNTVPITDLDTERFVVLDNGNLMIHEVLPADSGVFQCFVTNDAGEVNGATWLQVLSSVPEIVTRPSNVSVITGDSARLSCEVTGAPSPTITWTRVFSSGVEQVLLASMDGISILSDELLIPMTSTSDTARYTCTANNTKGIDSATAWLTVYVRTRIVAPPQNASVIKGSTHVLQCGVNHDIAVSVMWTWYHNSNLIPPTDTRRTVLSDGSLRMTSVRNEDIGLYRCEVTSAAGDDSATAGVQVIELPYPPSITVVQLNAESDRAVDVRWSPGFDGNTPIRSFIVQFRQTPTGVSLMTNEGWEVASRDVLPTQTLYTVEDLQPARSYQFRVSAVNDVGEGPASAQSETIQMPQQPPSGPPQGVVASPRSESAILIQWQAPLEETWNGQLLGYVVRYRPSGYPDSTLTYERIDSYVSLYYELTGLIVFTEYELSVAAYNAMGDGVYSSVIRVRTQEGVPTQAPRDVQATAQSSTSIKMQWLPPEAPNINGINQGYIINATQLGDTRSDTILTIPSNTSNMWGLQTTVIMDLYKYTDYQLTILCFTSKGNGPSSNPVVVRTLEDVPDQVGSLSFAEILDTRLQVLWTPPANINGVLQRYVLSYMLKGQQISKQSVVLTPTTLNYTVTGLSASTNYTIEVYAETRVGAGPPRSADIQSGVPPELPGAPHNLAITNIQATSVLLQFVPGSKGHTSISLWIVEAQIDGADSWVSIYTITAPAATSIEVQDLHPYTTYILRLIAENIAGRSEPSEPTREFQTIQASPSGPPQEVTVRTVNQTAIRVRWKPLESDFWNGEGRGYMIQYKESTIVDFTITVEVNNENANSHIFASLEEWTRYDVRVASYNKVGQSQYSPVTSDTTFESIPSSGPTSVNATTVNSSSIMVTWNDIPAQEQNGNILGYKIYYTATSDTMSELEILELNSSSVRSHALTDLYKYTYYSIQVLAYTRIGDGVLSTPAAITKTLEDVPGPPSSIYFPDVTESSARIVWSPPLHPNGIIIGYRIAYREKSRPPSYTIVDDTLSPNTLEYNVTGLSRTTYYVFSLTAETNVGWGITEEEEVYTINNRRVPDPPTTPSVGMMQVGPRWVTINWQPGNDGYSPLRNYTVQYARSGEDYQVVDDFIDPSLTTYTVEDLKPDTQYRFRIAATNDLGISEYSEASVVISTQEDAPDVPPADLEVIPKTTTSVSVQWQPPPADNWNGNITGYILAYDWLDEHTGWVVLPATLNTSILLTSLVFLSSYKFKVRAENSVGFSPWSEIVLHRMEAGVCADGFGGLYSSGFVHPFPEQMYIQMISSVDMISDKPPPEETWNGALQRGYQVWYRPLQYLEPVTSRVTRSTRQRVKRSTQYQTVSISYPNNDIHLTNLIAGKYYEIKVDAYNNRGHSDYSTPVDVYVGEAVPTEAPDNFVAEALGPTDILVSWNPPPTQAWNGDLLGYKIFYWQAGMEETSQIRTVAAVETSAVLESLQMFTEYHMVMLAFNAAGDGPNTTASIAAQTTEGLPSAPGELVFVMISLTDLNVSWSPPQQSNGVIQWYEVSYEEEIDPDEEGESRNVQVRITGNKTWYLASELTYDAQYNFAVSARTSIGWGPAQEAFIRTGPQPGSPAMPGQPALEPGDTSVKLQWINGAEGDDPISGYIIQGREKTVEEWETLLRTTSPEPEVIISFFNLKPNTEYQFRVIAVNSYGISPPSPPSNYHRTLEVDAKSFYEQWWFLVIVALTGLIFIIIVVSLLCLTGRRHKANKYKNNIPKTTIHLETRPPAPPSEGASVEEAGFATFDTRHSQRRPPHKPPKSNGLPPYTRYGTRDTYSSTRTPPRPSPGSVNYSDDESKYPDDQSSTVTDKPSETSSVTDSQMSDSDQESEKGPPPPAFVNHYVNGDVQQSWRRHQHGPSHSSNVYNYTDSEHDSNYAVTMNGGHVMMNNMAGSRAPLPGFSSFV